MVAVTMTSTNTSASERLQPALTNGTPLSSVSTDTMSVSEIKDQAKSNVQRIKGASALSLLKTAKEQSTSASLQEGAGDLKSALRAYIMASRSVDYP
jgi:ubiquitin carboxyl-terminal hydrolase 8